MIDGKEVKNRNYIECKNDTFENGYCEGIKCNMPKNNIKDGIFDGECKRNIKGDVPHKTECSLTCNENTYLSSENKLFRCNHGSLENKTTQGVSPRFVKTL